jgi:sugar/nucleoside kinase (ribokinase family)
MKQYNVYAIGNAMVDIDFEISDATVTRLNLAKGLMTLIDEDTHHKLLEELDGIKHVKACGGSAANTIITLQQLGASTFYSCKVGNDAFGDFYYHDLVSNGIHTNMKENTRTGTTGKCLVLVTPDAERTMNTFLGISAQFSKTELSEEAIKNSEYLYIEGYLVASPLGLEASITARELAEKHSVKTALSLSDPNMTTYFKHGLCNIIGDKVDILFCNEPEALIFTDTKNLAAAKEELKKFARTFVITLGGKGSLVYDGKQFSDIAVHKTNVIDTVGAGDVFAGAFLYAITHGANYVEAGNLASLCASKVVSKFGPRLSLDEVETITRNASFSSV